MNPAEHKRGWEPDDDGADFFAATRGLSIRPRRYSVTQTTGAASVARRDVTTLRQPSWDIGCRAPARISPVAAMQRQSQPPSPG